MPKITVRFQLLSLNPLLTYAGVVHGKFVLTRRGGGAGLMGFLEVRDEETEEFSTIEEATRKMVELRLDQKKIDEMIDELRGRRMVEDMADLVKCLCACQGVGVDHSDGLRLEPVTGRMWPLPFMELTNGHLKGDSFINTMVEAYDVAHQMTLSGRISAAAGISMVQTAQAYGLPLDQQDWNKRYDAIPPELLQRFEIFGRQMTEMFLTYAQGHVQSMEMPFGGDLFGFDNMLGMLRMSHISCNPTELLQSMPDPAKVLADMQAHLAAIAAPQPAPQIEPNLELSDTNDGQPATASTNGDETP